CRFARSASGLRVRRTGQPVHQDVAADAEVRGAALRAVAPPAGRAGRPCTARCSAAIAPDHWATVRPPASACQVVVEVVRAVAGPGWRCHALSLVRWDAAPIPVPAAAIVEAP